MGDALRRRAQLVDRPHDPAGQEQRSHHRRERRRSRHGEDLDVVVHVEHHPARGEHRSQRQHHREQGEARELQAQARQQTQRERRAQPHGQRDESDDDRG